MIGVSDLAVFMTLVMTSPGAAGKTLQPSWPELITWKRFHSALEEAFREDTPTTVPSFMVHTAALLGGALHLHRLLPHGNKDKARELTAPSWVLLQHEVEELTGWKPRMSPEDILREIGKAIRKFDK